MIQISSVVYKQVRYVDNELIPFIAKHYFQILDALWIALAASPEGFVDNCGFPFLDL